MNKLRKTLGPKTFPEQIPNELVKNVPNARTNPNKPYLFQETSTNFRLLPDIIASWLTLQTVLKIFVFHRSCTGANQMTSNTKNSLDSRRGCRARMNFNCELRKQRQPAAIDSPVFQWFNLIIANQLLIDCFRPLCDAANMHVDILLIFDELN